MKTMGKEAEQLVLDSIKDMCSEVNAGSDPTDAAVKVAEDRGLSKNFIKLMCTGYNSGASTYQRESGSGVLEKFAEVPLSRTEQVVEKLYPSQVLSPAEEKAAGAVSAEYSQPVQVFAKEAEADSKNLLAVNLKEAYGIQDQAPVEIPVADQMKRAYSEALSMRRDHELSRRTYTRLQDELLSGISRLTDYFKVSSYDRKWTLEEVDYAVSERFSKAGSLLMQAVTSRLPKTEKRASGPPKTVRPIEWNDTPFKLAAYCIDKAKQVNVIRQDFRDNEAHLNEKIAETLRPFDSAPTEKNDGILSQPAQEKEASFLGAMLGSGAVRGVASTLGSPPDRGNMVQGMADDLADPAHEAQLRQIQTQTMLQDLMNNDEVVSGYDPDTVADAFNEISESMPRASNRVAFVRPLLRKRLTQGAMEPFEAAEMANIEKTLGQSEDSQVNPMAKESDVLKNRSILD